MVRLASNSTCLGLVETLLSPPQKIHRARILNKIMIEKRIAYELEAKNIPRFKKKKIPEADIEKYEDYKIAKKPLPKDWKPKYLNGNVIDITPLIDDEWWKIERPEPNDDETKKREGLESLVASAQIPSASIKDQFQTYYSILSRYFTPSDLKGKSLKDLDRMLQMFIKSNGGLF